MDNTVAGLIKSLQKLNPESPIACQYFLPFDVATSAPDAEVSDEEAADTLYSMQKYQAAENPFNWDYMRECYPDSLKEKLKLNMTTLADVVSLLERGFQLSCHPYGEITLSGESLFSPDAPKTAMHWEGSSGFDLKEEDVSRVRITGKD